MKCDSITVGAGSVGAEITTRLSEEAGRSELLLENGTVYPKFVRLPDDKYGYATRFGFISNAAHGGAYDGDLTGMATDRQDHVAVPPSVGRPVYLRGLLEDYDSVERVQPYIRNVETDTDLREYFHGYE